MIKISKDNNKRSESYIKEKSVDNTSDSSNNYSYVNEKPDTYKRIKYEHIRKMLRIRQNLMHNKMSHTVERKMPEGFVYDKKALEMNYDEAEMCLSIYNKLFNDILHTMNFFKTDRVKITESPKGMTIVVQVVPKYKKVVKKVYKSVGSILQEELNEETNCGLK